MSTTTHSRVALTYAQSLLELAGNDAEAIGEELAAIEQLIDDNASFGLYLADPAIGEEERRTMLQKLFDGRASKLVYNFLRVLNTHNRLGSLSKIISAYHELLEDKLGKVEVDLTVAAPLSNEQLAVAQQKISKAIGRDAILHTYVDESIIGGMIIRVQDELIDASVKTQLQTMKRQMLAKMPR